MNKIKEIVKKINWCKISHKLEFVSCYPYAPFATYKCERCGETILKNKLHF